MDNQVNNSSTSPQFEKAIAIICGICGLLLFALLVRILFAIPARLHDHSFKFDLTFYVGMGLVVFPMVFLFMCAYALSGLSKQTHLMPTILKINPAIPMYCISALCTFGVIWLFLDPSQKKNLQFYIRLVQFLFSGWIFFKAARKKPHVFPSYGLLVFLVLDVIARLLDPSTPLYKIDIDNFILFFGTR